MACFPTSQAIVVGGGLGGMSAANTVVEHGGRVVLLDKSSFCGGNSTKATSGINGAGTKTQKAKGIPDNAEIFTQDTLKGGAKKPELAKLLCDNSADDVDWLVEKFNLDLSLVARLGGHSQPRTHRGKERFPGMTITYALIQMLEKVAEKTDLARIVTKAKVFKLVTEGNVCVGCVYEKGGQNFQEFGPVILASGGFGADFTSNSLLAQYRPDLLHLPTTNGEHCTGDGIKMGVPPKDFSHGAEAASLLVRLVRALPRGFLLRTMLEPLVQELLEAIFCDWPRTLPSLQDLKESEVTCERLGQLSTYAQLISGLRANLQVAQKATEEMKQKESTASMLAKTKSRAYEELRVQVRRLEDERDQSRVAKDVAQKQCAEAEEFFEVFKQQTKLALNDYGEMQYREATIRSDLNNLQVHCKEKDLLISELRNQTTALTHETHELEEKLLKVREEMERRTADVELLPELYKKLQYYESEEAVHSVEFARRVVDEVLGKSMEELTGRLPSSMPMEKRTQICMDSVVDHLVSAMRDAEKLKEQVLKMQQLLEEVKQLVPIWNEHTMQDVVEAYDEDAAVHRQIFSMNDKRSFAGLGLDESVPPYLRAEGFVRHRYMSKKECEDIMEAFHAEASGDLNTSSLHAELHQYLQRRFVEPEEFTEFAYAFICSLEAYRDDPDFELFDLMLAGAVHPSIMQDQETMLRELQTLVHSCADGGIENHSHHNHRGQRMTGNGKNFGARDQVTRRVMRAVMQAMFPEKSVDRMNCLMKALHQTLQMLFDAGRSSNPDAAFVSDLFSATADGTQSPLIEEMRRQHVHEVLEFTAEISHQLIRRAGGESYVNLHGRLDPHILIQREDTIFVLDKNFPEIKSTAMLESAWKLGDEGPQQVADVLQTFRNNFLLKRENAWVVVGPKAVVEKAVELAPGKLSKDGTKLEDSKVAQRNRALKVLDNPYSRDEGYTPQQLLKETRRVPRKFDEDMPEVED